MSTDNFAFRDKPPTPEAVSVGSGWKFRALTPTRRTTGCTAPAFTERDCTAPAFTDSRQRSRLDHLLSCDRAGLCQAAEYRRVRGL